MNYREKLQKFSIRKYTVGAFSTVIATLIFLGSPQAHASEQLQKDGQVIQAKARGQEQTSNETSNKQVQSSTEPKASPVSESQKANNETLNKVQTTDTLTNSLTSFSSQNENKDTSHTTTDLKENNEVQPQKNKSDDNSLAEVNEGHSPRDNRTRYEDREASDDTLVSSTLTTIDADKLQAAYDRSYAEYRKIDREQSDNKKVAKIKATFDKVNDFFSTNDNTNQALINELYKEIEQANALIGSLPQRQVSTISTRANREARAVRSSRRPVRGQGGTRPPSNTANTYTPPVVHNSRPKPGSKVKKNSDLYNNAKKEWYVENENDGSGYWSGTFLHATNKSAPYYATRSHYRNMSPSSVRGIAEISSIRQNDGYLWTINFNKYHIKRNGMVFWFGLPKGQTPTGPVRFTTTDVNGHETSSSGTGDGRDQALSRMWDSAGGITSSAYNFRQGNPLNRSEFYNDSVNHIYNLGDFARGNENQPFTFFEREGVPNKIKVAGDDIYRYLTGQVDHNQGIDHIYAFQARGTDSYTIQFKTSGSSQDRLYYAAGGRGIEFNEINNYNQLYLEPLEQYNDRKTKIVDVIDRVLHIDHVESAYDVPERRIMKKHYLDGDFATHEYAEDVSSYLSNPSDHVMGLFPRVPTDRYRGNFGVNPLNSYEIHEMFSEEKLKEAARTGRPIEIFVGFNVSDAYHNGETIKKVNLFVKPKLEQSIGFYSDNAPDNKENSPESQAAHHAVFLQQEGQMLNTVTNGNSKDYHQNIRIQFKSNESANVWEISGYPPSLRIEDAVDRPNTELEKNKVLVGQLPPGRHVMTARIGNETKIFEVIAKPNPPVISTLAAQLGQKGGKKPTITVTHVPQDERAKVRLVSGGTDGAGPGTSPLGYTVLAEKMANLDGTVTFEESDYTNPLPNNGVIRAITYYEDPVQSNFSNSINVGLDTTPPTFGDVRGLQDKYYRGDNVNISIPVSDNAYGSGVEDASITENSGLQAVFNRDTSGDAGTLVITGTISKNATWNSDILVQPVTHDRAGNNTNVSPYHLHIGKLSDDKPVQLFSQQELKTVGNPNSISQSERNDIINSLKAKNSSLTSFLSTLNPYMVGNDGRVVLTFKDGSTRIIDPTQVITYRPQRKSIYTEPGSSNTKEAFITIAKGQEYTIGPDLRKYFSLSNGQDIPNNAFTTINGSSIPSAQAMSRLNAGVYTYNVDALNAYNHSSERLTIKVNVVDVNTLAENQRVYRSTTKNLSNDEITQVRNAFKAANPQLNLNDSDIRIENDEPLSNHPSRVRVTITKGELTKQFISTFDHMDFLKWINLRNDYTVTWTSQKLNGRSTDGGFEWSPDGKTIIYRYDATIGRRITGNDVLSLLRATPKHAGLRNHIEGQEKILAESGSARGFKPVGYSKGNSIYSDGEHPFTYDGQPIQVLDIVDSNTGYSNSAVARSDYRHTSSNSTVMSGDIPAMNGAAGFHLDKVLKQNGTDNGIMGAVDKQQLYLTPYGAKSYIERLGQSMSSTDNVINIVFVPTDKVTPNIVLDNYNDHVVFSGETFRNTLTLTDNFGIKNVTVPNDSQIPMNVLNHSTLSGVAPNVSTPMSKQVKVKVTDGSDNETTAVFNVLIKPLKDKYSVMTTADESHPIRIANISNNASLSETDRQAIFNSLDISKSITNRNYVTEGSNEIRSREISNVHRSGNNANVEVTITYADNSRTSITVPVKHVIPNIRGIELFTVQGQPFPSGKGTNNNDFFVINNDQPLTDATVTWIGNGPDINSTTVGVPQILRANILFDGETTPIEKEAHYRVVKAKPKRVYQTTINGNFLSANEGSSSNVGAFVEGIANYLPSGTNFDWAPGSGRPLSNSPGVFTETINVIYPNGQVDPVNVLFKVKPTTPSIDALSTKYKADLSGQSIKVNNVPHNAQVKLYTEDGREMSNTTMTRNRDGSVSITIPGVLPLGNIKAKSIITVDHVTITEQNNSGSVVNSTRSESIESDLSASSPVTKQLEAVDGGLKFVKGDNIDLNNPRTYIKSNSDIIRVEWEQNANQWKNTIGTTTKRAIVTLSNGETRTVSIPVTIYAPATAKAPQRDVVGHALTYGDDAANYVTFENNYMNGATVTWKNNNAPSNNIAGVQSLTAEVRYNGINHVYNVPVKVYEYKYKFKKSEYSTIVGTSFEGNGNINNYVALENANGLPTDGFHFVWTQNTTASHSDQWSNLAHPNQAFKKEARFEVLDNQNHVFFTSDPAIFKVTNAVPNPATVTQNDVGDVVISPGVGKNLGVNAGNIIVNPDRITVKKGNQVIGTFVKNNTGKWAKASDSINTPGLSVSPDGNEIIYDKMSVPNDTLINTESTTGNGELTSEAAISATYKVKPATPSNTTFVFKQNGEFEVIPNNANASTTKNPTDKVKISYVEKIGNSTEQSRELIVTKNNQNQWSMNNQLDYVTLDSRTGKVTFKANSLKPHVLINTESIAGSDDNFSHNTVGIVGPEHHDVIIHEIVKEPGERVSNEELNNAINVDNKDHANVNEGVSLPTNLQSDTTQTVPTRITYRDGSIEIVNVPIRTHADKSSIRNALPKLNAQGDTNGKTPSSVNAYNNEMQHLHDEIEAVRRKANEVLSNDRATNTDVANATNNINDVSLKIQHAISLLQNKADNSALVEAKRQLDEATAEQDPTPGMTPATADNYRAKKAEAERISSEAQKVIDNGDATVEEIRNEKVKVEEALTQLTEAKNALKADKSVLEQKRPGLNHVGVTEGKKPASVTAYNNEMTKIHDELEAAKTEADRVIHDDNATPAQVTAAIAKIDAVQPKLNNAISLLHDKENNSELVKAKAKLDAATSEEDPTPGMTPATADNYRAKKVEAKRISAEAQSVIDNGDATAEEIRDEKAKVEEALTQLTEAKNALKADKSVLEQKRPGLNHVGVTEGKKPASVTAYNNEMTKIHDELEAAKTEADRVIHDDNATPAQVTAAIAKIDAVQPKLDNAISLLHDKENNSELVEAKRQLDEATAEQDPTPGMTQATADNYRAKKAAAEQVSAEAQSVIDNGDATAEEIRDEKAKVEEALTQLTEAKNALKADKSVLEQKRPGLNHVGVTEGKKPASVTAYNNEMAKIHDELEAAKTEADRVIHDDNATPAQVTAAIAKIDAVQPKLDNAISLLHDKENNSELVEAKRQLDEAITEQDPTPGMTQATTDNYRAKKAEAERISSEAQGVINNGDATAEEIRDEKAKVEEALIHLTEAKNALKADKSVLEQKRPGLNHVGVTEGKQPASVTAYNNEMAKIHDELEAAKTEADRVIHDDNATPAQVTAVIAKIDAVQPKLDNAISLLHDKENNSELVEAKRQLDEAIAEQDPTPGMTQATADNYRAKKAEAERISSEAQGVINNGDATAEEIRDEKAKVEEALTQLTEAKNALKADKSVLEQKRPVLNHVGVTEGKQPASVTTYNNEMAKIHDELEAAKTEADRVIHDDNATPAQVTAAIAKIDAVQPKLDNAISLLHDKENNSELVKAKTKLDAATSEEDPTPGMTPTTTDNYRAKKAEAERISSEAQSVIDNGDATAEEIRDEKAKVEEALTQLTEAKNALKADKSVLEQKRPGLNHVGVTEGKQPASVTAYNNEMAKIHDELEAAKTEADRVINDDNATPAQVTAAIAKIDVVQPKLDNAISLLHDKENNSELVKAKAKLDAAIGEEDPTPGMTQATADNYRAKKVEAERISVEAQSVIDNGDATAEEIRDEKVKVEKALTALNQAKDDLRADKTELQHKLPELDQRGITEGKKPASITAYNEALGRIQSEIEEAKTKAQEVLNKEKATPAEVKEALDKVKAVLPKLTEAISLLHDKENNSELVEAKRQLDEAIAEQDPTPGMTQATADNYRAKKAEAERISAEAQGVINNGDATAEEIRDEKAKVEEALTHLTEAKNALKADKSVLEQKRPGLNHVGVTEGKKPASVTAYNNEMSKIHDELEAAKTESDRVINDDNATPAQVTAAIAKIDAVQPKLDNAISLLHDKENNSELVEAKRQLDEATAEQDPTPGMTEATANNYKTKKAEAERISAEAQGVINNGDATAEEIRDEKAKVEEALTQLTEAKNALKADKSVLEQKRPGLNHVGVTEGKKPASVTAYNNEMSKIHDELEAAKTEADRVIHDDNATPAQVTAVIAKIDAVQPKLDNAISLLHDKENNSELVEAKRQLDEAIAEQDPTPGMTQATADNYRAKKAEAERISSEAQGVINNGDATAEEIRDEKAKVEEALTQLTEAKNALKADKSVLEQKRPGLNHVGVTEGKQPASVTTYNNEMAKIHDELEAAKTEADRVIHDDNATPAQVTAAIAKIDAVQPKLDNAISLLHDKENNSELVKAKTKLDAAIGEEDPTPGMTPATADNYRAKKVETERISAEAQSVIDNGDATAEEIRDEKVKVEKALTALNQAKDDLRADKTELQHKLPELDQRGITEGKKPASITAYNEALGRIQSEIEEAKTKAQEVLNKEKATPAEVKEALDKVKAVLPKLTEAISLLHDKENNSELVEAKRQLDEAIAEQDPTPGMTQATADNYRAKKAEAERISAEAQGVINNGDATAEEIRDEKVKVEEALTQLTEAKNALKADKSVLEQKRPGLNHVGVTEGKKPASVTAYNNEMTKIHDELEAAKTEADRVIHDDNATPAQVTAAIAKIDAVQPKLDNAISLLHDKENNSELVKAKTKLDAAIGEEDPTPGMTPATADNYRAKKVEAERISAEAQGVINNGDATAEEIRDEKAKVEEALIHLTEAKNALKADKSVLEQKRPGLNHVGVTEGKKPASVTAYNNEMTKIHDELEAAKTEADRVIHDDNATPAQVTAAIAKIDAVQPKLDNAISLLHDKENNSELVEAKRQLDEATAEQDPTPGMTPATADNYRAKKAAAEQVSAEAQSVIDNGDATAEEIRDEKTKVEEALTQLTEAKNALKADKSVLEQKRPGLNHVGVTEGKKPASVTAYNNEMAKIHDELEAAKTEADRVINDDNATPAQVTAAIAKIDAVQPKLENAISLLHDKENNSELVEAKRQLDEAIAEQDPTLGMTPATADNYRAKKAAAERISSEAQGVINNGDATAEEIRDEKAKVAEALTQLTEAKSALKADKSVLEQKRPGLNHVGVTEGKQPASVTAYNNEMAKIHDELEAAKTEADRVIHDDNATPAQVTAAIAKIDAVQPKLDNAISLLHDKENNSELVKAKAKLDAATSEEDPTPGMTPATADNYRAKKVEAERISAEAQGVINNGDATAEEIRDEKAKVEEALIHLTEAKNALKADKSVLEQKRPGLNHVGVTEGKKPASVTAYNNEMTKIHDELEAAKTEADRVIHDDNATPAQVTAAIAKIDAVQPKLDNAISLLHDKENNSELVEAKRQLDEATAEQDPTPGMTPATADNYRAKKAAAEQVSAEAQSVIDNGDATAEEIRDEKTKVEEALTQLTEAKNALKADKSVLEQKRPGLNHVGVTEGKKPASVTAYNNEMAKIHDELEAAKTEADRVINDDNATPAQVTAAIAKIDAVQPKLENAISLLHDKENNSELVEAKRQLDEAIAEQDPTLGMTPATADNYRAKKAAAERISSEAQGVINNGDATAEEIRDEKAKVAEALTQLTEAKSALKADKSVLEQKRPGLNHVGVTEGKQPASVTAYNNEMAKIHDELEAAKTEADRVIHDDNATPAQVTAAIAKIDAVQPKLDNAISLLHDKENNSELVKAKAKLDAATSEEDPTPGMTPATADNYRAKKAEAEQVSRDAQKVIENDDATSGEIAQAIAKVNEATVALKQAKHDLIPDKTLLNNAKNNLETSINQVPETKNMTSDSVENYRNKLSQAKDTLANAQKVIDNPTSTVDEIHKTIENVKRAKDELEQAKHDLILDYDAVIKKIKQQTDLTESQKDKLIEKTKASTTSDELENIKHNTNLLNDAMKQLKENIAEKDKIKASINYTDGDKDKKDTYDDALKEAEKLINDAKNPIIDPSVINQLKDKIIDAKNNLNGVEKLQNAKNNVKHILESLEHLNHAQKDAFNNMIDNENSRDNLDTIINKAKEVDKAMKHLIDEIADNLDIKHSVNYSEASPDKKSVYDELVKKAEDLINKGIGTNASLEEINKLIQDIKKAKHDLDGKHQVELAKQKALEELENEVNRLKDEIDNNPNLSKEDKEKLKSKLERLLEGAKGQINNATTLTDLIKIKDNIQKEIDKLKALIDAKILAKQEIIDFANKKRQEILNNSNLTSAQKQKALAEIDKALQKALKNINNANDINEINHKLKEGKDNIAKIVAKEITNALIDNKIKEIKARKDLTDEQKAKLIDYLEKLRHDTLKEIDKSHIDDIGSIIQKLINKLNMFDIDKIENILSHNNKDNNQNQSNVNTDGIKSNNSHLSKLHRLPDTGSEGTSIQLEIELMTLLVGLGLVLKNRRKKQKNNKNKR
nr:hyperosmolarity resistance protein Ebh [Staphylococcus hominis]